jgi:hypothetical protein
MKTFKQFLKSKTTEVPIADYYPSHGAHSQEKKKVPIADYKPSHGKHSVDEAIKQPKTISHAEFTSHNPNSKIHPSVTGVHEHLDPPEEKWNRALKPHEKEAVAEYTASSVSSNRELIDRAHGRPSNFEHKPDDSTWDKDWKTGRKAAHEKITKGLDSVLNRSKVPRNLTVFHGINATSSEKFNPGELASQHPDRHVRMPAYLSTTVDPHIASAFAKPEKYVGTEKKPTTTHMLRINLKRGQKGYRYVGDRSSINGEREGILKRDSVLKISEHPTIVHHPETGGHIHVWDAHVVD